MALGSILMIRLSNMLKGGKTPASLSAAEFHELLRLRNQGGQRWRYPWEYQSYPR
jgi:hypothetical protein